MYPGPIHRNAKGAEVIWVQEWLGLHGTGTAIDGDFGPATEKAVKLFQANAALPETGVVDEITYEALLAPMRRAVAPIPAVNRTLGELVVAYARQHLAEHPREIGGANRGPWVRLYMGGNDGPEWLWCAGFASFLLESACESAGVPMPIEASYSCDKLAARAKAKECFVAETEGRPAGVAPGAFFLVRSKPDDWTHVGIVTALDDETLRTIEGNTNDEGSREGYEVCARTRGYTKKDFIAFG